jgi:myosin heavy subunit
MSEAIKKDRRNLWQQLFGGSTSKEIEAAMEGARAALDNAGVVRKEFDTKKVKGLVEDMQARIMEILGELTDDEAKRTALANTIAAELMGTATEVVDETMPVEEMQDNPEEDEEQMPMQMMELTEQVKALASEANDVQDEMKELIPAFIEMTGIVKELAPLASKAQEFDALVGRMEKMEKLMALAPRPASTDKQTVIENTELKAEIDKGLRGTQKVLGLEVKS